MVYPHGLPELLEGPYRVRFARTTEDLDRVLRLRFEVFNLELREGLAESWNTGRDRDPYDDVCHHMMLIDERADRLVGTYRMQTVEMADAALGFYCDDEFDLGSVSAKVREHSVELGRACISREHRNGLALFGLWLGLAAYLRWSRKRFLFGCCSLTSQDPLEGEAMLQRLRREGRMSSEVHVRPRSGFECRAEGAAELPKVHVPRLFSTYLRYGAKACGPPAMDRAFGTIDFLIVLDVGKLDPRVRDLFFGKLPPEVLGERD